MVIGDVLAQKLFGTRQALGREVKFHGDRFEVVGILAPNQKSGIKLGYKWDEVAIIPITWPGVGTDVEEISMTVQHTEDGERAIRVANAILLHRHNGVDNFQFLDFGGLLKNFYTAFAVMRMVVALVASVALLIGGVGVMNIMLVSVNERMREIGLRKAIGATRGVILGQFLTEAVVLSLFGALIGVSAGVGLAVGGSKIIRMLNPAWVEDFSYGSVVIAVLAATAVGVFFGWYPAKRAAELEPIQCLRHE
jgi:putative ABC transport system permease protein